MKIKPTLTVLNLLAFFLTSSQIVLGQPFYTPKPGSKERKAILDSLRKPVVQEMKQAVIFYDVNMKVKDGWAYIIAVGRDTKGNTLKRWGNNDIDPAFQALLRKKSDKWQVLSWGAGTGMDPTDDAIKKYPKAPREIFPSGYSSSIDNTPHIEPTINKGVTLANYYRLKTGMTYQQVVQILGREGTEMSSSEIGQISTVMFMWRGQAHGGNMNAMFQNGQLVSKAQFNLD